MDLSTLILSLIVLYWALYIIGLCVVDCDFSLKWAEYFGLSIGSLSNKVIWITGASSGIGENLAIVLASNAKCRLVLSARRKDELERVKLMCLGGKKNLTNDDILVLPFDVTNYQSHENCFQKVIDHFGSLDVLVNNAGRSQRATWENIETDVDKELFDLNVFGVISLTRIAVRYFMKRGDGHVAVTSSIAGVLGVPYSGTYTASKWALHGYLNSLRAEKIGSNLKISILCPGPTFTNFLSESFTEKLGEKYGLSVATTDRRMRGDRCGELFAIALANHLPEVWVALFPIVPMCYLMVYLPNVGKFVAAKMGSKQFHKLRDSETTMKTE